MAAMCLAIANHMSLDSDRTRVTDMAQKWLDLAQTSEAGKVIGRGQQSEAGCALARLKNARQIRGSAPAYAIAEFDRPLPQEPRASPEIRPLPLVGPWAI